MVYNPYAKQSAKRPRPEHWNEPASRPPPSSSHNDQNIVPNHPPNNMASSVAAPQQIQSQRVARVLKKHGIVAGGQPPQGRSTSSSLANNAYQPNPTGTKPTQLVNNVYKPSNQLTGVYSERVCTYDSNESTMNHSSGVQPTISHRSSTTNTTANATSNIPQSLRTSTTAHGPRSLKPPPYLPNPNNHKRPTDSLQNNQSQLLQKSHAVQNLYTNKPPSGVHQMVRPIANIPPSSTSTALTNNSLYSSNNNEISCGSTSIINGMNQSQQQSQKNLSVPNNTTNPNVAVMQQASPIDPYAKNQNPSSTVIANDDSWASSKVNTTEGRGQNTHKSQTINPYCKTSSTITNTQRHVIASGISNQSIQRDAPVPSTQPSHRNGSSNVINEQTTRSIKSTPANPYLKSAGSASATNGYSAGTTNSQSNNFSTTANTLIQSQPTSSLSHRAENTSQGALSCAPERRSNPNQGQSQSAVLKDTSNTGEVVPVNAYRQNRSSQELPGVSNQHNPLVSIEHGAKAAGVKPSMPQPMKNAQAKGPPGSLASIRPPSWKANVTDPQKVENESITASKLELPGESILPKELQYSPDRMKPIKDEYRQKLVNNANLSKPLLNGCTLYSHQKRAILQGLMKRRMVLALDMGLGKTLIGCVWSKSFKLSYDCLKIFVVCPVSLKEEWKRTAENFTGLEVEDFNGKAKEDSQDLRICSWAKVPKAVDKSVVHYVVVFDEAHSMQSMQAARTKDALKFVDNKRCVGVLLLSGTPMKNGKPSNLFPLLRAVRHPLSEHQKAYEKHFCAGMEKNFGRGRVWDASGCSNLKQLKRLVTCNLLHLTKEQCLAELPPLTRETRQVPISSRSQIQYARGVKDVASIHTNALNTNDGGEAVLGAFQRLRVTCSFAKVGATVELAKSILEKEPSLVIFSCFAQVVKAVHEQLTNSGWAGELLTGETPQKKRQGMVDRFQAGLSPSFVCTFGAGGVGLTLTAACTVILLDRPWTPGETRQAEDRVRRIGQTKDVTSIWMSAFDVDAQIDAMLESKKNASNAVLADGGFPSDTAVKLNIPKLLASLLAKVSK